MIEFMYFLRTHFVKAKLKFTGNSNLTVFFFHSLLRNSSFAYRAAHHKYLPKIYKKKKKNIENWINKMNIILCQLLDSRLSRYFVNFCSKRRIHFDRTPIKYSFERNKMFNWFFFFFFIRFDSFSVPFILILSNFWIDWNEKESE